MTELSEKIVTLHAEGMSYRNIQAELGCSKGTIAYYLGAGQRDKTRQRQRDRRGKLKQHIQKIKQEAPCTDCGENYPYWIMEFDHTGDNKTFNISGAGIKLVSMEELIAEIAKCEVVCANCHRNRTHARGYKNGSNAMDVENHYASLV